MGTSHESVRCAAGMYQQCTRGEGTWLKWRQWAVARRAGVNQAAEVRSGGGRARVEWDTDRVTRRRGAERPVPSAEGANVRTSEVATRLAGLRRARVQLRLRLLPDSDSEKCQKCQTHGAIVAAKNANPTFISGTMGQRKISDDTRRHRN